MPAIRFNWKYYSNGKRIPSKNLKNELEEYGAIVDFVKKDKKIDASKVIVAGKSLGTLVAYLVSSPYYPIIQYKAGS